MRIPAMTIRLSEALFCCSMSLSGISELGLSSTEGESTLVPRLREERWPLGKVDRRNDGGREVEEFICSELRQPVVDARENGVLDLGFGSFEGSEKVDEDERAGMDILASIAAIAFAIPSPPCFLWRRRICVASSKRVSIFGRFAGGRSLWWERASGGEGR